MKKIFFIAFAICSLMYTQVNAQCWKLVVADTSRSAGIKTDGTLWAWGGNHCGQLGDGSTTARLSPVPVSVSGVTTWKTVAISSGHTFGIKTDGTLWAWGCAYQGVLASATSSSIPVQIGTDNDWIDVSTGLAHAIALKSTGAIYSWGTGNRGQLGQGTSGMSSAILPTQIGSATDWVAISCGSEHSLALNSSGKVYSFGANYDGQLGLGTTTNMNVPTCVNCSGSPSIVSQISAGSYHSMMIDNTGKIFGFGANGSSRLGDGTTSNRLSPVAIGASSTWSSVAAGLFHTMAVRNDGTLWAWGANYEGQLGVGSSVTISSIPIQVGTASNWVQVSAGLHTQALKNTKERWACGRNPYGEIGDGATTNVFPITMIGTSCSPVLSPCKTVIPASISLGLLAFYPFGGGTIYDYSGNSNHLNNSTTAHPSRDRNGKIDCAYHFDMANHDFLNLASPSFINNITNAPFSISLWYQPTGTRPIGDYELLIGRDNGLNCPDTYGQWSMGLYDCRKVVVGFDQYSHWQTSPVTDCNALMTSISNQWHHAAFVYDGTNYDLYVDGVLYNNNHGPCGSLATNVGDFLVGRHFTGDLDDIFIYNRAISASEVNALRNLGSSCCGDSVWATKIQDLFINQVNGIRIYPNPSNGGIVNIQSKSPMNKVELYDNIGRLLAQYNTISEQMSISTANLNSGVYFIKAYTADGIVVNKLLVE